MFSNLISLLGIATLLLIAVAFSSNRRAIRPRIVVSAFLLQAAIAAFVLYLPFGKRVIQSISDGVMAVVGFSEAGTSLVFGTLYTTEGAFSFAINVLPIIVFFASLMAVLYHLGVMQFFVRLLGNAIRFVVGTKPVESLNAAANVFVGQTEAPLVVRPYLVNLTRPQLFAIMVSGVASVAGTVLAAYAQLGVRLDYLLAASFMAAPGGLLMAKIIMPDDDGGSLAADAEWSDADHRREKNVILAAASGAQDGVRLAVNIGGMLIAFVALIALVNGLVGGLGSLVGIESLTMQRILGYVFAPLMWLLSVPWQEAQIAGALFGQKLILNEFVAFLDLANYLGDLTPRTEAVITFSLCGFANLSSIAILLGGLGVLIPQQRELIGEFGLKAVAAGSLSNLMSAALASLLIAF